MKTLFFADRTLTTTRPAFVMGIVNVTPDSFYAPSRTESTVNGLDAALRLIDEGADILDIGGESTRPGAQYVTADEEIQRVVPLIQQLRARGAVIPISVDTRKSAVLRAALDAGADMLNDVSALEDDAALAPLCASTHIPVVLMHKAGVPRSMQHNPLTADCFERVNAYLTARAHYAETCGIAGDKIIVDPGIGFGKNTEANLSLVRQCGALCEGRYPVLMALSRKTLIGELLATASGGAVCAEERLYGTLCANLLSVLFGASIIRVHDVKAAVDTMTVLGKIGYTKAHECVQ